VPGAIKSDGTYIRIYPLRAAAYEVPVWTGEGGHGGGDDVILADLFLPEKKADKYQRASDQRGGAYSILTGRCRQPLFPQRKSGGDCGPRPGNPAAGLSGHAVAHAAVPMPPQAEARLEPQDNHLSLTPMKTTYPQRVAAIGSGRPRQSARL